MTLVKEIREIIAERRALRREQIRLAKLFDRDFDMQYLVNMIRLAHCEQKNVLITLKDGTSIRVFDPDSAVTVMTDAGPVTEWIPGPIEPPKRRGRQ